MFNYQDSTEDTTEKTIVHDNQKSTQENKNMNSVSKKGQKRPSNRFFFEISWGIPRDPKTTHFKRGSTSTTGSFSWERITNDVLFTSSVNTTTPPHHSWLSHRPDFGTNLDSWYSKHGAERKSDMPCCIAFGRDSWNEASFFGNVFFGTKHFLGSFTRGPKTQPFFWSRKVGKLDLVKLSKDHGVQLNCQGQKAKSP